MLGESFKKIMRTLKKTSVQIRDYLSSSRKYHDPTAEEAILATVNALNVGEES